MFYCFLLCSIVFEGREGVLKGRKLKGTEIERNKVPSIFPFVFALAMTCKVSCFLLFRYLKTNLLPEMICLRNYCFLCYFGNTTVFNAYSRIY